MGKDKKQTDLLKALKAKNSATRLKAALELGLHPDQRLLSEIIDQCLTDPDFYVRDTLTWTLTRFPKEITAPRLVSKLNSSSNLEKSQALHALSKIKDMSTWPAITKSLLRDSDDEVARSAWRAAVILVPEDQKVNLAKELAKQFGRGHYEVQLSLSLALVALGEDVLAPILNEAKKSNIEKICLHASATERILRDPNVGFELALNEAKRVYILEGKQR